jgi:ABC-type lipoprotein release transport system permease subunit
MQFTLFKLAWRNIWRNKRRAIITISSIVVSLLLSLFMRQMQNWTYANNTKSSISGYVGYIQITVSAFVDEAILDNTFSADQIPLEAIQNTEGVTEVLPRLTSGALVSTGLKSKYAGVMGIDPAVDNEGLKLPVKLLDGELLAANDDGILITQNMSKFYQVGVGDSLILFGQGFQGYSAAGIYPIKGILNFPAGEMANMVYMALPTAQQLFYLEDRYTHYLINLEGRGWLQKVYPEIQHIVTDENLTVRTWEEVLPGLKQGLEVDSASGLIMVGILYMIVGFGILGTIVMLYNERTFEFGVLSAVGMNRFKILATVLIELNLLTLIGIALAILLSFPIFAFVQANPIELTGEAAKQILEQGFEPYLSVGMYADVYIGNAIAVWAIALVAMAYVVYKILTLNALEAMRQH